MILGLEADFDFSSQNGTGTGTIVGGAAGCLFSWTDKIQDFGTVRGRLGLPFDRWMPYVTGGYAWQYVTASSAAVGTTPPAPVGTFPIASNSTALSGWTIGGGVEAKLWPRWSVRAEYLYIDTGRYNTATAVTPPIGAVGTVINESTRFTNNVLRVGLNYYFSGP
jgi:outer membrane immunogenic protein